MILFIALSPQQCLLQEGFVHVKLLYCKYLRTESRYYCPFLCLVSAELCSQALY